MSKKRKNTRSSEHDALAAAVQRVVDEGASLRMLMQRALKNWYGDTRVIERLARKAEQRFRKARTFCRATYEAVYVFFQDNLHSRLPRAAAQAT